MHDSFQAFFQKSRAVALTMVFQIFRSLNPLPKSMVEVTPAPIAIFEFTSILIENAGTQVITLTCFCLRGLIIISGGLTFQILIVIKQKLNHHQRPTSTYNNTHFSLRLRNDRSSRTTQKDET